MENLNEKIYAVLFEKKGWSRNFAEGFLSGRLARASNINISLYGNVGIDDYSGGFRAGYYGRHQRKPANTLQIAA